MKAVVLLSGGLDSTVCMAVAKEKGLDIYPISFDYHQKHCVELESAKKVAAFYHIKKHLIIDTNMDQIGGSALTDTSMEVPAGDVDRNDIPSTYVPARNLIFLSYALGYAEVVEAETVFIGVNSVDYSGYPDCRPEFIRLFQSLADYSTKASVAEGRKISIETPLMHLSKKEIVLLGHRLDAPLAMTHSCYNGGKEACGVCDSCKLRLRGFQEAGIEDPVTYL